MQMNSFQKREGYHFFRELFDEKYINLNYTELLEQCHKVEISLIYKQIEMIEKETINQAKDSASLITGLDELVHLSVMQLVTLILHSHHHLLSKQFVIPTCLSFLLQLQGMAANMKSWQSLNMKSRRRQNITTLR